VARRAGRSTEVIASEVQQCLALGAITWISEGVETGVDRSGACYRKPLEDLFRSDNPVMRFAPTTATGVSANHSGCTKAVKVPYGRSTT
jgi:hypothetical protein